MKPKRKSLTPQMRKKIHQKYDGHCAYCGCPIELKDMQADHIEAVYRTECKRSKGMENLTDDELNSLQNFMPACRQCNFYKSTLSIEDFRQHVQSITDRLQGVFIYKLAIKYGLVQECNKPIRFYFEIVKNKN